MQSFHAVEQQIGSFAFYRTTLDFGGPVSAGDGLFYRFDMAYENAGSFIDFAQNERVFIAPKLRWEIDAATQITFDFHYLNTRDPFINGIPVFGSPPRIPTCPAPPTSMTRLARASRK
ncbi:hypothetical protein [Methylosinus trichosporium]|uniref:hypothetical protein n=1 Tax=Methylosinus sp. 3S-1 TaxID=1849840 RepID=UPI0001D2E57A